jgi:hypothetical protein
VRSTSQQGVLKNQFDFDGKLPSVLLFMNLAKDQFWNLAQDQLKLVPGKVVFLDTRTEQTHDSQPAPLNGQPFIPGTPGTRREFREWRPADRSWLMPNQPSQSSRRDAALKVTTAAPSWLARWQPAPPGAGERWDKLFPIHSEMNIQERMSMTAAVSSTRPKS